MLVDLRQNRLDLVLHEVGAGIVQRHRVGLVVDQHADFQPIKRLDDLLIGSVVSFNVLFPRHEFVIVNNDDFRAYFVPFLDNSSLPLHAFRIDRRSGEDEVEAHRCELMTVNIPNLVHGVEDHNRSAWLATVARCESFR